MDKRGKGDTKKMDRNWVDYLSDIKRDIHSMLH